MFLFLSKFLPQFVYPLGFSIILLIGHLYFQKKEKRSSLLVIFAILVLWIGGSDFFSNAITRSLEWRYLPPKEFPQAEAIVLLGGGVNPPIYPRLIPDLNQSGERIVFAAWLYQQKKAPEILVSGAPLPWSGIPTTEAEAMKRLLLIMGVPEKDILIEDHSKNTYENAVFSRKILAEQGINHVLLVTSALHMPRAVMVFKKQGLDVIPAPTDFNVTENTDQTTKQLLIDFLTKILPSPENLDTTTRAIKEYLGIVIYRLRGWG